MIGHKDLEKRFKKLIKDSDLSHGYIFYGEPQVGKFIFAKRLANYIEFNDLELEGRTFTETLIIESLKGESAEASIGIDAIRSLRTFIYEKPVNSKYRVAIINDAHLMTDQAQNAILKIAEEPPQHALLILIAPNLEVLITTVLSRFQKIYFGNISKSEIAEFLVGKYGVKTSRAKEIADISFGRPGRAVDLINNDKFIAIRNDALDFLRGRKNKKDLIAELADIINRDKIEPFLGELIAELSLKPLDNFRKLKTLGDRLRMIKEWNTNKRIQLEAALQSIGH